MMILMLNLRKIFFVTTFFFILLTVKSYAEVVNTIAIKGNERISKETIAMFGDIAIGKNYEDSDINLVIKKLYDTTFFSKISVTLENNVLQILVEENPIINTIVLNGEDAKKHTDKIKSLVTLKEKNSFIESKIKNDLNIMK